MRCAVCGGGGFAKISLHHFGCSTARNKGTCANLRTIRRDVLETTVLDALRHRLMDPELYARTLSFKVQQDLLPSASRGTRAARDGLWVKFQRLLPAEFRRSPRFTIDRALAKEQRFRGSRSIWGMSVQARARHRMPQAGGLR